MADNSPEKSDAAAPVVGSEDVPDSDSGAKVAGEGESAAKTADKSEGDAVMEEAKEAQGKLLQRACSRHFRAFCWTLACKFHCCNHNVFWLCGVAAASCYLFFFFFSFSPSLPLLFVYVTLCTPMDFALIAACHRRTQGA